MIGAAQWLITLSRFDIAHAIMSLGRFHAAPREGHLERLKRVIGYVRKRSHCAIRFRTGIPNYEEQFGDDLLVPDSRATASPEVSKTRDT